MTAFLAFTLQAPMASFGSIAVGERRETWDRPAKSAVLGLVGAALGIQRDDRPGQEALSAGYGYAVRTDNPGRLSADYHTAQVPPRKRGFRTRRNELLAEKLETILSRRDYRSDALHTALLWAHAAARWRLDEIAAALLRPMFTLYLGRKSCPLGLPLSPRIVDAETIVAALSAYDDGMLEDERELRRALDLWPTADARIAADDDGVPRGGKELRRERRRDQALSRTSWQFGLRDEIVLSPTGEAEGSGSHRD